LLDALDLVQVEEPSLQDVFEAGADILAFELDGWLVLVTSEDFLGRPEEVAAASRGGEAISAYMDERVTVSGSHGAANGELTWSVRHASEFGVEHLEVRGTPPAALSEIQEQQLQDQALEEDDRVDHVFEIPLRLVWEMCPFNPYTFDTEMECAVLGRKPAIRKPGFFARLFGRRKADDR